MITFIISLVALILGYLIYGAIVERVMRPDDRETPAVRLADGVDYVVLPTWKVFMIQFLNIAGTGPIFGAIMGAKFKVEGGFPADMSGKQSAWPCRRPQRFGFDPCVGEIPRSRKR